MKAAVYTEYGPPEVLHLAEVEKPVPNDDEILIRIHATSISTGDLMARRFSQISAREFRMPLPLLLPSKIFFGWNKPKINILGAELAGDVEAVGAKVTRFKPGDPVFAYLGQSMGAYAEYRAMPETGVVALKPAQMSYEQAAVVPYGGIMALNLLRKVDIRPGERVLIIGASGGIGSAAVQLAVNHFDARVTGVCSTPRVDFVRALGAESVIDYTREDFTQTSERYDVIFDVLNHSSFARCKSLLQAEGRYLLANFKLKQLIEMLWTSMIGNKKVICALSPERTEDLVTIKELVEAGKFKAIIDRSFPLEQAAEAHRYVESGQKQAQVVITI